MKILYVSTLCSPEVVNGIFERTGRNPGFAVQKFNRLIAVGMHRAGADVSTLSAPPIVGGGSLVCRLRSDTYEGIRFRYIPFLNLPVFRHLCLFLYSFFYILGWGLKGKKDKRVVCDVLNVSVCMGALLASKLTGLKSCGIMTDMPGLMAGESKTLLRRTISAINRSYLSGFDYYVFLTEAMNEKVNKHHRPYIIMEGLVDADAQVAEVADPSERSKSIIYAGGLYEKYGIKKLIEGFIGVDDPGATLDLYGSGPMVEEIKAYGQKDSRVRYHGVVPNEKIVDAERRATLLVNPRPSNEPLTLYSFPSKNMEYMVSGTPVLTTPLPGMPTEYYPYVYILEDETVEGIRLKLTELLCLPPTDLFATGRRGRHFVLTTKNNEKQASRILSLLTS